MAHLEMRRLAMCLAAALQPIGNPRHHLSGTDARIAKQAMRLLGIAQQSITALRALYYQRAAKTLGELLGETADAQQLRPGEIEDHRRSSDVGERSQGHRIGVC